MSTSTRLARRQARATSRIAKIQKRYGLLPSTGPVRSPTPAGVISGDVTVPSTSLPPPPVSSPITAVMDTAPVVPIVADPASITTPQTSTITTPAPTDMLGFPSMATPLPRLTKQQLKYERRRLKKMPKELARIRKLNELRAMQEFTLNQQIGAPPDLSLIRGGAMYQGPSQQPASMFDPMAAGAPPGWFAPQPGGFGPPINQFSPTAFQQPSAMPPGGLMMPPSMSGVPGGLIYTDVPEITSDIDLSSEPIFEEEGELFGEYLEMEPLDSYGAVTGEPAQVGFFDKLSGLIGQAGQQYADIEKAKAAARTAKYQAAFQQSRSVPPASSQMRTGGSLNPQALMSMGLVVLGGWLILRAVRN